MNDGELLKKTCGMIANGTPWEKIQPYLDQVKEIQQEWHILEVKQAQKLLQSYSFVPKKEAPGGNRRRRGKMEILSWHSWKERMKDPDFFLIGRDPVPYKGARGRMVNRKGPILEFFEAGARRVMKLGLRKKAKRKIHKVTSNDWNR